MTESIVHDHPLGVKQAAKRLGISESYLYKLTSRREIPHFKSRGGKRVYFKAEDLDSWAYGRRVETSQEIDQVAATRVVMGR